MRSTIFLILLQPGKEDHFSAILLAMDLQTVQLIFYSLGSIFFGMMLVLIIAVVIKYFVVMKKITKISNQVNRKISQIKNVYDHKEKYILELITKGSSSLVEAIVSNFIKKKK